MSNVDLYRAFIEYVSRDLQSARKTLNRRMINVFFWCFLFPALAATLAFLLLKFGVLPLWVRRYMDWIVIVFPILYLLYVLSSEVLSEIPRIFRRGGTGQMLAQSVKDCEWRARTADELKQVVPATSAQWRWILTNYRVDIESIRNRTKYLTAFGGAVFFLIMQGIDSIGGTNEPPMELTYQALQGWFQSSSNNLAGFVGLGLFLMLFYLSGNQTYQSLARYLHTGELLILGQEENKQP